MENANSPFDGIFSLLLLLRRNSPSPEPCPRPQTSYTPSSRPLARSGSVTPPPTEITLSSCRPGHPADSFQRTVSSDRVLRRRSKWSWTGRSGPEETVDSLAPSVAAVSPVMAANGKRKRASVARMMTWSSSGNSAQYDMERDSYMSERAHARHTMAMDRKLPRVHEAHIEEETEDDEEQHNAAVQRQGIVDEDDIREVKRDRALAALEKELPLRSGSDTYDNIVEMRVGMGGVHRGAWGEAWSPL